MTYKRQNNRPRNWRASKSNQQFRPDRDFRLLEKMFWYHNRIKSAYNEAKKEREIYISGHGDNNGGRSIGAISNPTQRLAFKNMEPIHSVIIKNEFKDDYMIKHPAEWITVVEKTLEYFDKVDKMVKNILQKRYLTNEGSSRTCIDLEININKYYKARDVGLQYARECAIQLGLLKAFE